MTLYAILIQKLVVIFDPAEKVISVSKKFWARLGSFFKSAKLGSARLYLSMKIKDFFVVSNLTTCTIGTTGSSETLYTSF